jgi:hypothetical protein
MQEIRHPTDKEKFEIEYYLRLDETDLHSLYKLYLQPESSRSVFVFKQGRHPNYEPYLQQLICGQWGLCNQLNDLYFEDRTDLIVAIANVIMASDISIPVPALLIATTIVKGGAHKFCRCRGLYATKFTKQ